MNARGFPGFERCLWMMRRSNPQLKEDGFHALLPHASEYADELIAAFHTEPDHALRCWLLELIAEARSTAAFGLLLENLHGDDDAFRSWAIRGLEKLGDKRARTVLYEAQQRSFGNAAETHQTREEIQRALDRLRSAM
jgi:hypothetical protein